MSSQTIKDAAKVGEKYFSYLIGLVTWMFVVVFCNDTLMKDFECGKLDLLDFYDNYDGDSPQSSSPSPILSSCLDDAHEPERTGREEQSPGGSELIDAYSYLQRALDEIKVLSDTQGRKLITLQRDIENRQDNSHAFKKNHREVVLGLEAEVRGLRDEVFRHSSATGEIRISNLTEQLRGKNQELKVFNLQLADASKDGDDMESAMLLLEHSNNLLRDSLLREKELTKQLKRKLRDEKADTWALRQRSELNQQAVVESQENERLARANVHKLKLERRGWRIALTEANLKLQRPRPELCDKSVTTNEDNVPVQDGELASKRTALAAAESEIKDLQNTIQAQMGKDNLLTSELRAATDNAHATGDELRSTKATLATAESNAVKMNEEVLKMQISYETHLNDAQAHNEATQSRLTEAEETIRSLRRELDTKDGIIASVQCSVSPNQDQGQPHSEQELMSWEQELLDLVDGSSNQPQEPSSSQQGSSNLPQEPSDWPEEVDLEQFQFKDPGSQAFYDSIDTSVPQEASQFDTFESIFPESDAVENDVAGNDNLLSSIPRNSAVESNTPRDNVPKSDFKIPGLSTLYPDQDDGASNVPLGDLISDRLPTPQAQQASKRPLTDPEVLHQQDLEKLFWFPKGTDNVGGGAGKNSTRQTDEVIGARKKLKPRGFKQKS